MGYTSDVFKSEYMPVASRVYRIHLHHTLFSVGSLLKGDWHEFWQTVGSLLIYAEQYVLHYGIINGIDDWWPRSNWNAYEKQRIQLMTCYYPWAIVYTIHVLNKDWMTKQLCAVNALKCWFMYHHSPIKLLWTKMALFITWLYVVHLSP